MAVVVTCPPEVQLGSRALGAGKATSHRTTVRLTPLEWETIEAAAWIAGLGVGRFLALSGVDGAGRGLETDVVPEVGEHIGCGCAVEVVHAVPDGPSAEHVRFAPATGRTCKAGSVLMVKRKGGSWRVLVALVERRLWMGPWMADRDEVVNTAIREVQKRALVLQI